MRLASASAYILSFALDDRREIHSRDLELLQHFGEIEGGRLAAGCASALRTLLTFFGHRIFSWLGAGRPT